MCAKLRRFTPQPKYALIPAMILLLYQGIAPAALAQWGPWRHPILLLSDQSIEFINLSGRNLGPGELELRRVAEGRDILLDTRSVFPLPRGVVRMIDIPAENFQFGAYYRLLFTADCSDEASGVVRIETIVFQYTRIARRLTVWPKDVVPRHPSPSGGLVRIDFPVADTSTDVLAYAGDLIEIDFLFKDIPIEAVPADLPKVVLQSGAHGRDLTPAGSRTIFTIDKATKKRNRVGIACFFEAKRPCDDLIIVDVGGIERIFHVWVLEHRPIRTAEVPKTSTEESVQRNREPAYSTDSLVSVDRQ